MIRAGAVLHGAECAKRRKTKGAKRGWAHKNGEKPRRAEIEDSLNKETRH